MLSQHNDDKESVMAQLFEGDGITPSATVKCPEGVKEEEPVNASPHALSKTRALVTMGPTEEIASTESLPQKCASESDVRFSKGSTQ